MSEMVQGKGGQRIEHGRVEPRDEGAESVHPVGQIGLGNAPAVHLDALAEVDEMGGTVETHVAARGLDNRCEHGGHRPFAVGARDLGQGHRALWIADGGQERLDAVEAGTHARDLAAPQPGDSGHGLPVGHGACWGRPEKKATMRRSVSRSSRRSTTMSS